MLIEINQSLKFGGWKFENSGNVCFNCLKTDYSLPSFSVFSTVFVFHCPRLGYSEAKYPKNIVTSYLPGFTKDSSVEQDHFLTKVLLDLSHLLKF